MYSLWIEWDSCDSVRGKYATFVIKVRPCTVYVRGSSNESDSRENFPRSVLTDAINGNKMLPWQWVFIQICTITNLYVGEPACYVRTFGWFNFEWMRKEKYQQLYLAHVFPVRRTFLRRMKLVEEIYEKFRTFFLARLCDETWRKLGEFGKFWMICPLIYGRNHEDDYVWCIYSPFVEYISMFNEIQRNPSFVSSPFAKSSKNSPRLLWFYQSDSR